ncbi:MAG: GAF domain-containing protein [Armatimonadetes bacterium]|nr:GAF domain-containing protein [Armatimonadota bacterium]
MPRSFQTAIRSGLFSSHIELLDSILVATDKGVLLTDLNHAAVVCNPQFGQIFGVDFTAVIDLEFEQVREMVLARICDKSAWLENLEVLYADPLLCQRDFLKLQNPTAILSRDTRPVFDTKGNVLGRLWTFRDQTHEVRNREMRDELFKISQLVDPDPGHVYREIVERIGTFFGSICFLSLRHGDYMEFRAIGGPDGPARQMAGNTLDDSYCQFCLNQDAPKVIQDARQDPGGSLLTACKIGLTRYLGVPVRLPSGQTVGTLCILDERSDEPVQDYEVDFIAMCATRIAGELLRESEFDQRIAQLREAKASQEIALIRFQEALSAIHRSFRVLSQNLPVVQICEQLTLILNGFGGITIGVIEVGTQPFPPHSGGVLLQLPGNYFGRIVMVQPIVQSQFRTVYESTLVSHVNLLLTQVLLGAQLGESESALDKAGFKLIEQAKLALSGTLATSIAHDIRNILATLSFHLAQPPTVESWSLVKTQIERFEVLNHRLLVYAKPHARTVEGVNIGVVCEGCLTLLTPVASAHGVTLAIEQAAEAVSVQGDEGLLEHLLVNLIINAIEAMSSTGGSVKISYGSEDGRAMIRVSDTGPGIPWEIQESLFEPFVTSRKTGFGLGLFSCRRIAGEHRGTLELVDTTSAGTTFEVNLPC